MKKLNFIIVLACLVLVAGVVSFSQEGRADRATVSFSDPSKPGFLEVGVHRGSITVKGYNGKEVIIEARAITRKIEDPDEEAQLREVARADRTRARTEEEEKKPKNTEGMRKIQAPMVTGLSVEEKNNKMEVDVSSMRQAVDLTLQVPFSTSLELSAHMDGDITVENIAGDIEVNHHAGALNLTGISGTVVAHTFSGDVTVTFAKVTPDKPMSFSTWGGDIDVTFPSSVKATVKMKSEHGEIYSDFDIQIDTSVQKVEKDERKDGGKYKINFDKYIVGKINGGGPDFQFNTYGGDILIRKSK
jgi:hypothetical protein